MASDSNLGPIALSCYQVVVEDVNKDALRVFLENPKNGLFYTKDMSKSWEAVEGRIEVLSKMLLGLLKISKSIRRLDLENALRKFALLYSSDAFSTEEFQVNSFRLQAAGIKMMLTRIRLKAQNTKDGSRTQPEMKMLIEAYKTAPAQLSPSCLLYTSPSPRD